jgi:hypothetical protein
MARRASDDIKSSQFLYEEELVGVVFQKPLPATKVGGLDLPSSVEGSEARIPLWAARVLSKEGIVKLSLDEGQDLKSSELFKLSWKEERNEMLSPLPANFYPKLRDLVDDLNRSIKENPTHTTLSEQRQAYMKAKDLINCRLQKILRLSFERNPPKGAVEALQPEERAIFEALRSEIEEWREKILAEENK